MKTPTSIKNIAAAVAASLVLALPAQHSAAAEVLRLSTYVNEVDIRHRGFQKFAELAEQKTGGRVKVEIFPSATLHGWSEGVDSVTSGISDISWINADKRLPCYRVTSLYPASINLDGQVRMDADYADLIRAEAAKINLVPLINSNYSYDQEWWFKGPANLDKLDGKLVRSIGLHIKVRNATKGKKGGGKMSFCFVERMIYGASSFDGKGPGGNRGAVARGFFAVAHSAASGLLPQQHKPGSAAQPKRRGGL